MSNDLYAVVKRTLNGVECRTIERMSPSETVCFFDCAAVWDGAAVSTISGLWHLEGETVNVLADGGWHPDVTVAAGAVTLDNDYSLVVLGYRREEEINTLPQILERYPAFGVGALKNVDKVWLRIAGDSGISVGPTGGDMIDHTLRSNTLMTGLPSQHDAEVIEVPLLPGWQDDCSVTITNDSGRPITIISISYDLSASG
jgi:hypothetical protein